MVKKFFLVIMLGFGGSVAAIVFGQSQAFACSVASGGVCGYFKGGNDSAWCNVLPDTSIRFNYSTNNCWLNSGGGNGRSRLFGVTTTNNFINGMSAYLNTSSVAGYAPEYVRNSQAGAAFIIDYMLGIDRNNGNTGTGINDARAQFGNWSNVINTLGVHQCATNNGTMVCPGTTFGINWKYVPPNFCSNPTFTSAYDPWGAYDTPIYDTDGNCAHDYSASIPEIVFYWNNGANSFHIGSQCGNVQSRADKLPPLNRLPGGTISISCDPNTGIETATVNFSDADGATTGYITTAGHQSGNVASGAPRAIAMPASWTDPYVAQGVSLFVRDVGPLGSGNYNFITSTNTIVPCATLGCSINVTPVPPIDPYMRFNATVTVVNNVNQTPPGNVNLQITPPAGAAYSYNGNLPLTAGAGSSTSVTFANLGPTNNAGVFTMTATVTGSGLNFNCPGSVSPVYLPYVNVYGGDVMVGASPTYNAGSSSCTTDPSGGAFSWNNHSSGYSGAGGQYAVQTLATITDFASALSSSMNPPTDLSFANAFLPPDPTKLNPAQGLFGGYFGASTSDCDFTSDIGFAPTPGDLTIPATTVPVGTSVVHYVTSGDVYITGNITYAGAGGWADPTQIPSFKLVVIGGGHIYIDSNVTQLDGLYVTEPTLAGAGGRIYTCASAIRVPVLPTTPGYYATCNKRLVVNGAFVAQQVWLGRTFGSVGQAQITDNLPPAPNHDAEVFNYTPELWLPRSNTTPPDAYAAITGLPPVL